MPTRKMVLNWSQPENTPLHRVPAQTMVVFFMGCMYCVMAPFFLPVCGVFFSLFYLFFKHNLVYHYMQPYSSGQTLWPWLVTNTFNCLIISQTVLVLGLPTLSTDNGPSTEYLRLALLPLPFVSWVQIRRTFQVLEHARKVPVHKEFGSAKAEDVNERGVIGDLKKMQGRVQDNVRAMASPTKDGNSKSKKKDGNRKSKDDRSVIMGVGSTKNLNLSHAEAAKQVRKHIADGTWRNYQPINLWPKVQERAAASVIIKRWKANKAAKQAREDKKAAAGGSARG